MLLSWVMSHEIGIMLSLSSWLMSHETGITLCVWKLWNWTCSSLSLKKSNLMPLKYFTLEFVSLWFCSCCFCFWVLLSETWFVYWFIHICLSCTFNHYNFKLCIVTLGAVVWYITFILLPPPTAQVQFLAMKDFSLLHVVQNSSGTHPSSYPMGTGGSLPRGEAVVLWNWPLISI
jgi:hypothetical protein